MRKKSILARMFLLVAIATALTLGIYSFAAAHCDTFDGPVIQDTRKAMESEDVTPVLKWVKQKDEKVVRTVFAKAQSARGKENPDAAENNFFITLVRIHRAGEGAPFSGLKSTGEVEPALVEADKALASGSSDDLVKLVTNDVAAGIRTRYERARLLTSTKMKASIRAASLLKRTLSTRIMSNGFIWMQLAREHMTNTMKDLSILTPSMVQLKSISISTHCKIMNISGTQTAAIIGRRQCH